MALETSREVAVVDAQGRYEIFRIKVGRAPQGLAVSDDGRRLYVNNFMDRTVGVYDLTRAARSRRMERAAARDAAGRRGRDAHGQVLKASSSSTTRATRASRATGT